MSAQKFVIAPSILAADFGNLNNSIQIVNESKAQWLHVDIMDGVFVPNISFGAPIMETIQKYCNKFIDVHLMIIQPERYISLFRSLGANCISVHYEACTHLHRTIYQIKELGALAGVAINPHTAVEHLIPILQDLDLVCMMSVNPGFGGQNFILYTYQKLQKLKELANIYNPKLFIEIDGGVNQNNASELLQKGANVFVAGNFVFNSSNPLNTINNLFEQLNAG